MPTPNYPSKKIPPAPPWAKDFKTEWISKEIDRACIKYAEDLAGYLCDNKLTTSQLRNFFGELKRIQMKGYSHSSSRVSFLLLKPKMAYAVGRQDKYSRLGLETLAQVFNKAYDHVDNEMSFKNMVDFMESIIAFHKAKGGK